jgi:predicted DNA-binding protein
MTKKNNLSRMTIDISNEDHRRLKAIAAIYGKSMREIVLEAVEQYLRDDKTTSDPKKLAKDFDPLSKD